jgi:type VI secretion system protein ImpK
MSPSRSGEHKELAARTRARSRDNLPLLYQGMFAAVTRLQAGRKKISESQTFRRKMKAALADVERNATALNYDFQDIQDAHLAVVSLLDEVVLGSNDPAKAEWIRFPFAHELLGQPVAGEVFFDRLEGLLRSRKDTEQTADLLEVYLLCMLLGFEGKYAGGHRGDLHAFMERTRARINGIRQRGRRLSPEGALPDDAVPAVAGAQPADRLFLIAAVSVAAMFGLFFFFKIDLGWLGGQVRQILTGT